MQASIAGVLTSQGKVKVAERAMRVVVANVPANLYRIREVIKKLGEVTDQVFIDFRIMRMDLSNMGNHRASGSGAWHRRIECDPF
ncbi:MAG: hypothetical protein WC530_00995 [Candidatus Omnitrophota bacterium]|jgi:putative component of toxin-antitoxin plasmid stabilization module